MRSVVLALVLLVMVGSPASAAERVDSVKTTYTRESDTGISRFSVLAVQYNAPPTAEYVEWRDLTIEADGVGLPDGPIIVPGQSFGDEHLFLAGVVMVNGEPLYFVRLLVLDGAYIDKWFASGMEPITEAFTELVRPFYDGEPRPLAERIPTLADLPDGFAVDATPTT